MCFSDRNTFSLGADARPRTRRRTLRWMLCQQKFFETCVNMPSAVPSWGLSFSGSRSRLADFLFQFLTCVADPLVLVRIRGAQIANLRRGLPYEAGIRPFDNQMGLFFDGDRNPLRDRKLDRMRIAKRQHK